MQAALAGGDQHKSILTSNPSVVKTKHPDPYGMPARCPSTPEQQCLSFMGVGKKNQRNQQGRIFCPN